MSLPPLDYFPTLALRRHYDQHKDLQQQFSTIVPILSNYEILCGRSEYRRGKFFRWGNVSTSGSAGACTRATSPTFPHLAKKLSPAGFAQAAQ
jgi:hypothetical protein